jgi:hypothetical protein
MADVAFVLIKQPAALAPAAIVTAARRYGIDLTPRAADADDTQVLSFDVAGGASMTVAMIAVPHPDAAAMPVGLTSPPLEEITAAAAHLIVAAFGLDGSARERDTRMALLAAAVIDTVEAVAAMLGHGVSFHRAALFADAARLSADEGEPLMVEVAVDVTAAAESETHMSFLTHGLRRYGREELYVTCPIQGTGALGFVLDLARWMVSDPDMYLPTGDTVGRTAEEKIEVQRVPDPTGKGPEVIRLDLP